jgi:hypothetical protein
MVVLSIGATNAVLILATATSWACHLATVLWGAAKGASMMDEPPEYALPPAVKSALKTGLLVLMAQSTGMCWFCTRSYTIPHGLSEFAIVCVGRPMSSTVAPGANDVRPVTGAFRGSRASKRARRLRRRRSYYQRDIVVRAGRTCAHGERSWRRA